jgi:hypothetical protein
VDFEKEKARLNKERISDEGNRPGEGKQNNPGLSARPPQPGGRRKEKLKK